MSDTLSSTLGLDASRALDPSRFEVSGMPPRIAVRPGTRDEAAEALRAATRDGLRVVPWGGGVSLPHEAAPASYDVALDLSALAALVEYQPDDLTLTAECGITVGALRAELARRGQELPLEAGLAPRATLGGALAANASGPRRRRFGAPRDRVIGARYLLGDGSGARSGGKVVKNVAGYGIHRLLCGSRGGLAVILEASLKLLPAPAARVALVFGLDVAAVKDRVRWASFARLEPAALTVMSADHATAAGFEQKGAPLVAVVALEDDAAWVDEQERTVTHALGRPARRVDGGDAVSLLERIADLEESGGARASLTTADTTPAALDQVFAAVESTGEANPSFVFHALAGRLHLWLAAERAQALVNQLGESGWALVDHRGAGAIEPAVPPQAAVLAMRAGLRQAIDPGARFAFGERWQVRSL
jgi:glycolate oxidase FAD binding subunit